MRSNRPTVTATRARLLAAAGDVFVERGYRAATVREICRRAGANVAAVNYHFRDKAQLYAAVLTAAHQCALEKYPPELALLPDAGPRERLAAFVHSMMLRLRDPGRPAWQTRLFARELADPTAALDAVARDAIRPTFERLAAIVRALLPAGADEDSVRLGAASIVGQCLFWHFADPVVRRLPLLKSFARADAVARIADHITRFSLAALDRGAAATRRTRPRETRP